MMISTVKAEIENCGDYFLVSLLAACDLADIEAAVLQLYQLTDFIQQPRLLLDLSAAEEVKNAHKVLQMAVNFYEKRTFDTPGKTALVLSDDSYQQLVQAFSALASPLPVELKTFTTTADAEAWLIA